MGGQWGRCGGDGVRFERTMRASRYNADPARVAKSVTAVDLKSTAAWLTGSSPVPGTTVESHIMSCAAGVFHRSAADVAASGPASPALRLLGHEYAR